MLKGIGALILGNTFMIMAMIFVSIYMNGAMGVFMGLFLTFITLGFLFSVFGFVQIYLSDRKKKDKSSPSATQEDKENN